MDFEKSFLVVVVITTIGFMGCSWAYHHRVGESIWSIPLSQDFYKNWSSSHTFRVGDSLVFDFESGFYNVIQVSRREYQDCTANSPFRAFGEGPATVPLHEEGVYYFLCSLGNYCLLGQKLSVLVQNNPAPPPPLRPPASSSGPCEPMWASGPAVISSSPSPNPSINRVQVGNIAPVPTRRGPSQFSSVVGPSAAAAASPSIVQSSAASSGDAACKCGGLSTLMVFVAIAGTFFWSISD